MGDRLVEGLVERRVGGPHRRNTLLVEGPVLVVVAQDAILLGSVQTKVVMTCRQVELLEVSLLLVLLDLDEGAALAIHLEARTLDGGQVACRCRRLDSSLVVVQVEVEGHVWMPRSTELAGLRTPTVGNAQPCDKLIHTVAGVTIDDALGPVVGIMVSHAEEFLAPIVVVRHDFVHASQLARSGDLLGRKKIGVEAAILVALHRNALLGRTGIEFLGLCNGLHKGLVAHHVFACLECLSRKTVVRTNWGADFHHVDFRIRKERIDFGRVVDAGNAGPRSSHISGIDRFDPKLVG